MIFSILNLLNNKPDLYSNTHLWEILKQYHQICVFVNSVEVKLAGYNANTIDTSVLYPLDSGTSIYKTRISQQQWQYLRCDWQRKGEIAIAINSGSSVVLCRNRQYRFWPISDIPIQIWARYKYQYF